MNKHAELIRQIAYDRRYSPESSRWTPDELFAALNAAAQLDPDTLRTIAEQVGIRFSDPDTGVEQYLMVLDEANDKEKLRSLLRTHGR